jgi:hypothetical protein
MLIWPIFNDRRRCLPPRFGMIRPPQSRVKPSQVGSVSIVARHRVPLLDLEAFDHLLHHAGEGNADAGDVGFLEDLIRLLRMALRDSLNILKK